MSDIRSIVFAAGGIALQAAVILGALRLARKIGRERREAEALNDRRRKHGRGRRSLRSENENENEGRGRFDSLRSSANAEGLRERRVSDGK